MYREDMIKVVEKYYKTIIHDFSVINAAAMTKSGKLSFKKKDFTEDLENFKYVKEKLAKYAEVLDLIKKEEDPEADATYELLDANMAHLDEVIDDSIDYFDCMDKIRRKEEISFKDNKEKLQRLQGHMSEFRNALADLDMSYQKLLPEEETTEEE